MFNVVNDKRCVCDTKKIRLLLVTLIFSTVVLSAIARQFCRIIFFVKAFKESLSSRMSNEWSLSYLISANHKFVFLLFFST